MPGDICLKADKMSMANSVEIRVPLLDKEVMKVAETTPTKYLFNYKDTKWAFRWLLIGIYRKNGLRALRWASQPSPCMASRKEVLPRST